MRGNPVLPIGAVVTLRSIPARAGEPKFGTEFQALYTVYPRACGGTDLTDV